jgi:hypothetical protein
MISIFNLYPPKILDREWVEMILEALEVGISVEEIKEFLVKKGSPALKAE